MHKLKLTATSGNGYSVNVTHYSVNGTVIRNKQYPFKFRLQAAGYIGDMHTLYTALGYKSEFVYQPGVWAYKVADQGTTLLEIDQRVAARIRLELIENPPGYVPPPVEDEDETLALSADERVRLSRSVFDLRF